MSSRNYLVIDVAAGPTAYGPVVGRSGAVSDETMPSLRGVYSRILRDLEAYRDQGHALSEEQREAVAARHAQHALFEGALASAVAAASRAMFAPDLATEHLEHARNVLVPVVLLTDYELTEDDYSKRLTHDNFMGINLTTVERGVGRLIDAGQEAVVVSAQHPLSRHRGVAAALFKARRTRVEPAAVSAAGGSHAGYHTWSATHVDAAALMEELALSADKLTHGLVGAAHALSKHGSHALEQLRHDGTRVVPVFVLSLMQAPEDLKFANREVVAASHDAVVVLQLRQR